MFGLGAAEILVVLALALMVLGPQKLPEMAKQLARFLGELRRVSDDMRRNFDESMRDPPAPPPQLAAAEASDHSPKADETVPRPPTIGADPTEPSADKNPISSSQPAPSGDSPEKS